MNALGKVTALLLSAVTAVVVGVGLRSIPDVRRYLKMRNM